MKSDDIWLVGSSDIEYSDNISNLSSTGSDGKDANGVQEPKLPPKKVKNLNRAYIDSKDNVRRGSEKSSSSDELLQHPNRRRNNTKSTGKKATLNKKLTSKHFNAGYSSNEFSIESEDVEHEVRNLLPDDKTPIQHRSATG